MKTPRLLRLAAFLFPLVLAACGNRAPEQAPAASEPPAATEAPATTEAAAGQAPALASDQLCPSPPYCGDHCSNYPFVPTDCMTTTYGPAKADIIVGPDPLKSTNFLYCNGGSYALCFFSGPPDSTGKPHTHNSALPCVLEGDVANCTCQVYTSGAYFVDINAILNLGAYYETVKRCGANGERCANIKNCGQDGSQQGCDKWPQAPVCQYVKDQNPKDPTVSLMPKADLVSTFSFAMDETYQIGSTSCPSGLYAGCMTAPCFFKPGAPQPPADGDPIQCQCPTYTGDYQVGQFREKAECTIPPGSNGQSYVWSAANTVTPDGG